MASGQLEFAGESALTSAILKDKRIDTRYVMPTSNIVGSQCAVAGPNLKIRSRKELEGKNIGMAAGLGVAIAVGNMAKQCELGLRRLAAV